MLGASTFLTQVPSQCADVPLACFIVATLAVTYGDVLRIPDPGSRIPGVIAGATSAMAAWTKNEGRRLCAADVARALSCVAVAGSSRWTAASVGDRRRSSDSDRCCVVQAGARALIGSRRGTVTDCRPHSTSRSRSPCNRAWVDGAACDALECAVAVAVFPIVSLVAAWMAVRVGGAVRVMTMVLGLMLVSYYVVYVTTPFDITWHVTTSVDRLLVQLWPALVLTVFLGLQSARTPVQHSTVDRTRKTADNCNAIFAS